VTATAESVVGASVDREVTVIDCDAHLAPRSFGELVEYMDEPWRSRAVPRLAGGKKTFMTFGDSKRGDSHPEDGDSGSDPELVGRQMFLEAGTDFVLVLPLTGGFSVDPELNAAFAAGTNRWLAASWLSEYNAEGRYFGSITVSLDDPAAAAREIETWAGDPRFRQVLISHYGGQPFGYPQYDVVWATAAKYDLPVAMHFKRVGGKPFGLSPTGQFQHFVDYHSLNYPLSYAAHLVSWICSGVLDRHPNLKFAFVEGGFLWYRPIVTRLEAHWSRTARELGLGGRSPLEYVRDHFRWTTQPIETSEPPRVAARLFEAADADRVLLFSSDYPHYDYDSPLRALPADLAPQTKRRILSENARELYGLPATRPADRFDGTPGDAGGSRAP
jgi:uncharacterized protein